ncbi:expressed unknown protein [Seminavis robusta]|uniref:Uncharacterized protein n=1 Tax=Seminavis robusta TaxID=568900 RepID=A0A9N8ENE2_9STRA|nr:expressed unknown protein [Seminavis robusta]|eukprot:Sro1277_g258660.1 n/a (252) ;mRNA; f:10260-11096
MCPSGSKDEQDARKKLSTKKSAVKKRMGEFAATLRDDDKALFEALPPVDVGKDLWKLDRNSELYKFISKFTPGQKKMSERLRKGGEQLQTLKQLVEESRQVERGGGENLDPNHAALARQPSPQPPMMPGMAIQGHGLQQDVMQGQYAMEQQGLHCAGLPHRPPNHVVQEMPFGPPHAMEHPGYPAMGQYHPPYTMGYCGYRAMAQQVQPTPPHAMGFLTVAEQPRFQPTHRPLPRVTGTTNNFTAASTMVL